MSVQLGRGLVMLGALIMAAGLFLMFQDRLPFLRHIGRLPGDFHIKKDNVQVYFPLATSLILSVILSLFFWFFRGGSR